MKTILLLSILCIYSVNSNATIKTTAIKANPK